MGDANQATVADETAAMAFGKLFVANLDPPKIRAGVNTPDPSTFYGSSPRGHTDYPALGENTTVNDGPLSVGHIAIGAFRQQRPLGIGQPERALPTNGLHQRHTA